MNKNLSNDAYYQALNDAALAPLEDIRKDSAIRLLLGGIIGKGAYEISQEINMDYMTLLKNLDKIANLMKAVKNIVKDHPVILIIDDTHDHKQYARAIPVSRNATQVYYCKVHKRYEPAIQILIITVKDLKTNETYIVSIIPYIPQKVVEILKERGEKVEFKTKIQAYLEILPKLEEEFNVVSKVFDSWYVNSKTLLEDTVGLYPFSR